MYLWVHVGKKSVQEVVSINANMGLNLPCLESSAGWSRMLLNSLDSLVSDHFFLHSCGQGSVPQSWSEIDLV